MPFLQNILFIFQIMGHRLHFNTKFYLLLIKPSLKSCFSYCIISHISLVLIMSGIRLHSLDGFVYLVILYRQVKIHTLYLFLFYNSKLGWSQGQKLQPADWRILGI